MHELTNDEKNALNSALRKSATVISDGTNEADSAASRAGEAGANLTAGLGVTLQVKGELFSFYSKQDWVNKAMSRYANCGVRKDFYITLDALGRVMHMGKCFENASYPVTVYELETTWTE